MSEDHPTIKLLEEKFGAQHFEVTEYTAGMVAVIVPKSLLADFIQFLHDDERCSYEQLIDIIGIDYKGYPRQTTRFALVYQLLSHRYNRRLVIKVLLEEPDLTVPTLTGIYHSADWPEREAAEMFGFTFEGHPNPKRLLLCDLFDRVHPLRKDYPLKGRGERDNFKLVHQDTT